MSPTFLLRKIDPVFWARVQAKAKAEGLTVKAVILKLLTAWLGVFLLAAPVSAQPSPVHLAVDWANGQAIAGWTLNCYTGQQTAALTVFYLGENQMLIPAAVPIQWRLSRPDVQAAAPWICPAAVPETITPSGPFLGFTVVLSPGAVPSGRRLIVLQATDPVFQPTTDADHLGTQFWQGWVFVP